MAGSWSFGLVFELVERNDDADDRNRKVKPLLPIVAHGTTSFQPREYDPANANLQCGKITTPHGALFTEYAETAACTK
jgi:hypothetical protein